MSAEENYSSRAYLERFKSASKSIQDVRYKLNSIRQNMEKHILSCKISRGIGTGASTVGYAAFVGSFFFPPLAFVGIGLTAAGGTMGIGVAIGDSLVTNSGIKEISDSVETFKSHYNLVLLLCERFAQTVFYNSARLKENFELIRDFMNDQNNQLEVKWIDLKTIPAEFWIEAIKIAGQSAPHIMLFTCASYAKPAVYKTVIETLELANKCLIGPALAGVRVIIKAMLKILETCAKDSTVILAKSGSVVVETVETAGATVGSVAVETAGATAGAVAKTSTRAVAPAVAMSVLGGVMVAVDITYTIFQNHFQKHVTIEQLNGVSPFIEAIDDEIKNILKELNVFLAHRW